MRKVDLFQDVSSLSTVPKISLDKLAVLADKAIGHAIYESTINGDDSSMSIDIGIGCIVINMSNSSDVHFRFEPSYKLIGIINNVLDNSESPLVDETERILVDKIINTYKDLYC